MTLDCCGLGSADRSYHPHAHTRVDTTRLTDRVLEPLYHAYGTHTEPTYTMPSVQHRLDKHTVYHPVMNRIVRGTPINLRDLNVVFDEELTLPDIILAMQEYCDL